MSRIDEQLAILQAAKEGKEIELRYRSQSEWHTMDVTDTGYDFVGYEYRIKKEPGVIYSVSYKRGSDWDLWSNHFSKKDAESVALAAQDGGYTVIIRKFVEEVSPCSD